jgi:hypothetical protein
VTDCGSAFASSEAVAPLVIARCAKRAVAIQLDCFVAALLAMTRFGYDVV